jgi:hypothetical protein
MTYEISFDPAAIGLSAFITFALAAFWFSPALFGRIWQKQIRADEQRMAELITLKTFCFAFLMLILFSAVVNVIVDKFGAVGLSQGVFSGIIIWLAITMAHAAVYVAFDRRSPWLFMIYSGYFLVASVVASTLFALWR